MRKNAPPKKLNKRKVRRKARRTLDEATQTLREAVRPAEPTALRLVSLDAGCAHININRTLSITTALKILEVLRQDHAGAD